MAFGRLWAGRVFGTNTGNAFAKFEGDDSALIGSLHHNDTGVGMVVYRTAGSFNGNRLSIEGMPETKIDGVQIGRLKATAVLQPTGSLEGEWETDVGSAGTFVLFPHDRSQVALFGLWSQLAARTLSSTRRNISWQEKGWMVDSGAAIHGILVDRHRGQRYSSLACGLSEGFTVTDQPIIGLAFLLESTPC